MNPATVFVTKPQVDMAENKILERKEVNEEAKSQGDSDRPAVLQTVQVQLLAPEPASELEGPQ